MVLEHAAGGDLGRRHGPALRHPRHRHVRAGGAGSDGRPAGRAGRRRPGAGVRDRHRPGRRPAGRARRPVSGIELSRPMVGQLRTKVDEATIPVVVGDMATAGRPGRVHARVPGVQHHLQPADPGGAGRLLPQRGPAPLPRRPVRHRAVGARAAHPPTGAGGHGLARRARLHRPGHLRRPCTSTSSPTTSGSATAGTPGCSAARTATSGRPSST